MTMEVKDRAERHAAVEPVQQPVVAGERRYSRLNPRVGGHHFCVRNCEVSHHAYRFGMFAESVLSLLAMKPSRLETTCMVTAGLSLCASFRAMFFLGTS
jgi:hypothetical protein